MGNINTIKSLSNIIKKMEIELGLLTDDYYGQDARLLWESFRVEFVFLLTNKLNLYEPFNKECEPITITKRDKILFIIKAIHRSWIFAPRNREFLFLANPRRKISKNNLFIDPYTDDLLNEINLSRVVLLEGPYKWKHYSPTPHKLWYTDINIILSKLFSIVIRRMYKGTIKRMSKDIYLYLSNYIEINIDIFPLLVAKSKFLKSYQLTYKIMLKYLKPKKIVLVCSYGKESLILAARKLNIPTIELQHGVISNNHFGYSVPTGYKKYSFPDYIYLFGEYWKNSVVFSIPKSRQKILGYPYYSKTKESFLDISKKNQLVVISQWSIGRELSFVAINLALKYKDKINVVYKLHPEEIAEWSIRYPELKESMDAGIISVISEDEITLYELLAESKWQLGVYSTAIFEGLSFGCKTYLANLPGIDFMLALIQSGYAKVINSESDIGLEKNETWPSVDSNDFFYSDWKKQVVNLF